MTTKTKTKTLLIIVAVFGVLLFAVGFGLMDHNYNFPDWTRDVENLAIEYLSENEDILELYGNNLNLKYKGTTSYSNCSVSGWLILCVCYVLAGQSVPLTNTVAATN